MLLSLIATTYAGRDVQVTWQEARVAEVELAPHGVEVVIEVRDVCAFRIQNLWYFEEYSEQDRPCSTWRALEATEPERRLMAEPLQTTRPIRGPVVSGEVHTMTATVQTPPTLAGSEVEARFDRATLVLDGDDIGAALVLADLQREEAPTVALELDGTLAWEGHAVDLSWQVPNRRQVVDTYPLKLDDEAFPLVAEQWRCSALTSISSEQYLALNEPGLLAGYAVATCDAAAKAQGPGLCSAAARELQGASLVSAEATRAWVEPVLDHCGADWTNAARKLVQGHYTRALTRGDLGDASALVSTWADEMGDDWTAQATAQVEQMVRDQIPARFDWARRNGATDQARDLIEQYGSVLGPDWKSQAEARL